MPTHDELASAIERVRRRYVSLLEQMPRSRPAPAAWRLEEHALCWHVVLEDALEPDVDVQVLADALVVRAADPPWQTLLPVPFPFGLDHASIRFEAGVLHVRVRLEG
jgi:hypothetical protein